MLSEIWKIEEFMISLELLCIEMQETLLWCKNSLIWMVSMNTQFKVGLDGTIFLTKDLGIYCTDCLLSTLKIKEILINQETEIWFVGLVMDTYISLPVLSTITEDTTTICGKIWTMERIWKIGSSSTKDTRELCTEPTLM